VPEEIALAFATKADEDGFLGDGGAAAGEFCQASGRVLDQTAGKRRCPERKPAAASR